LISLKDGTVESYLESKLKPGIHDDHPTCLKCSIARDAAVTRSQTTAVVDGLQCLWLKREVVVSSLPILVVIAMDGATPSSSAPALGFPQYIKLGGLQYRLQGRVHSKTKTGTHFFAVVCAKLPTPGWYHYDDMGNSNVAYRIDKSGAFPEQKPMDLVSYGVYVKEAALSDVGVDKENVPC
jgi:hypothetical protein